MLKLRADVTLAPLALDHAERMYQWMCDPTVSHNIGLRSTPSLEKTRAWIAIAIQDPSIRPFAVLLKDQHIGNIILDRIDSYLSTARLSIYIGEPSARGSGVGLTALYQALAEGFERMALHKVWLTVHYQNIRAIATYIRLGFMLEGILRDEFWLNGQRLSVLYMGLLASDFTHLTSIVGRE